MAAQQQRRPARSRDRTTIALMYHALTGAGSPEAGQDLHYSIDATVFSEHVRRLCSIAGGVVSARDWLGDAQVEGAVMTFDDGHLSNALLALPVLLEHRARADFFVNPARVGSAGFAGWNQLREMAESGMSIQSHGWDHRYFTELEGNALREDLVRSRSTIEDRIGYAATLLAPPGGRMPRGLPELARQCGYQHVLSSRPGRMHRLGSTTLPRMAITAGINSRTLEGWFAGRGLYEAQLRYCALALAKGALGNRTYERVRSRLLDKSVAHR